MLIMALSYTQKTNDTSMIKTYVRESFTHMSVFADIVVVRGSCTMYMLYWFANPPL
jgi:hypothetical protein